MKKILLTLILAAAATATFAQPKAMGIRTGISGLEAAYEHNINRNQYIEANFGIDFGYNANGKPGVKATAIYDFVWAHPAWTNKGSWALYAGPGITMGYVNDNVHYKVDKEVLHYDDDGFMLGVCVQVGLEYTFWFPLQLSVDLRPVVGMHVNNEYKVQSPIDPDVTYNGARTGFYDNGLLGFAPTISVKYKF